jgi:hypothetical protein
MKSLIAKRTVVVKKRKTSITLEERLLASPD